MSDTPPPRPRLTRPTKICRRAAADAGLFGSAVCDSGLDRRLDRHGLDADRLAGAHGERAGQGNRNPSQWQQRALASGAQLAKELAQDRDGKLRGNSEMARKLSDILTKALDTPLPKGTGTQETSERQEALQLRYYLARSLGLFTVDDGTTVLLRAAAPSDNTEELPVQVAALDSLGQLASAMHTPAKDAPASSVKPWEHEAAVRAALLAASQREEVEIRERAAFHLGHSPTQP